MSSGIYVIECEDYFYVGQAQDLTRRKRQHWSDLRNNKHCNKFMQRLWNKYGSESFSFKVLLECGVADLGRHEQFLLDMHHGDPDCMNLAKDASAPARGLKHSDEAKARIGAGNIGRRNQPVYALLPDGSCVFYQSVSVVAKEWGG